MFVNHIISLKLRFKDRLTDNTAGTLGKESMQGFFFGVATKILYIVVTEILLFIEL